MSTTMSRRAAIALAGLLAAVWAGLALAAPISLKIPLTGAEQVPPVQTPGSGTADLTWDPTTRVVTWSITYSGLSSPVTMAHFHGPAETDLQIVPGLGRVVVRVQSPHVVPVARAGAERDELRAQERAVVE